jgi:hypothetical protein
MKPKAFLKKGRKRLEKIFGRIVPYNVRFRPAGVCRLNLDDAPTLNTQELKGHIIYRNAVTTLDISDKLYNACNEYWKPNRKVVTDYIVVEVPSGRIHTDNESSVSIITRFNRVIENVSLSLTEGKVTEPNLNNIFEQRFFRVPLKLKGTVYSLLTGGAGLNNISHWFLDVLPRLHLLRESGLYDKVDWFLVPSLQYDYQRESLELLGIPANKIIAGDQNPHVTADCIIASTAPRGSHTLVPKWVSSYIQNSFLPLAQKATLASIEPASPYLYISRSDSNVRTVLNEPELVEALSKEGFVNIISSKLSIIEKIRLFSQAKVVIGATGAGLVNMFFCKPGTQFIEIFNENFVVEPFFDIAHKVDLDYNYIICKGNGNVQSMNEGQRQNLHVDVDKLLTVIKKNKTEKYLYQTA